MRTTLHILLLTVATWLASAGNMLAQDETVYRLELGIGGGVNFMLSDANSAFYGDSKLAAGFVARFPLNPRMAVKTALTYGKIGGNTEGVENFFPANPNATGSERLKHQFSGGLFDLTALYELHFLPYGYEQGYQGYSRIVPYIQAGFGLSYSSAGKAFTPNFPVGVGLKYKEIGRAHV